MSINRDIIIKRLNVSFLIFFINVRVQNTLSIVQICIGRKMNACYPGPESQGWMNYYVMYKVYIALIRHGLVKYIITEFQQIKKQTHKNSILDKLQWFWQGEILKSKCEEYLFWVTTLKLYFLVNLKSRLKSVAGSQTRFQQFGSVKKFCIWALCW